MSATLFVGALAHGGANEDLIAAVDKGELSKAERALKRGANPEARGKQNATALMLASELGHVDIARALLKAGANAATTREGGIAAIHHAAGGGQLATLKLLLSSDAGASVRTDTGLTPLIVAGSSGKIDVVKALLEAGADRAEQDKNGMTPFMSAARTHCIECLQLLRIPDKDINAPLASGHSVMDFAVASRSPAVVRYLIEQGATFATAKSAKDQALFAFLSTPTDVLLKRPGATQETFKMLIDSGANLEPKNSKGQTPLILAAQMGDTAAVQALVEAKANVHARDKEEATALIEASSRSILEGAKTALAIGQGASIQQAYSAVEKADKSPATAARHAIARALLQAGADVNAANKDGDTALHEATQLGDVELIGILLTAGADVNARTTTGRTALMTAAIWSHVECVTALLAAGADTSIVAEDGRTALSIAKSNDHREVVRQIEAAAKK